MPNAALQNPPSADPKEAQKYINALVDLINLEKIRVKRSNNLEQYNLKDHFRLSLEEYEIEVSHRSQSDDKSSYVMVFSNSSLIHTASNKQVILAYIYLSDEQYKEFYEAATAQIQREESRIAEEKFKEAMSPIDNILEKLLSKQFSEEEETSIESEQVEIKEKKITNTTSIFTENDVLDRFNRAEGENIKEELEDGIDNIAPAFSPVRD